MEVGLILAYVAIVFFYTHLSTNLPAKFSVLKPICMFMSFFTLMLLITSFYVTLPDEQTQFTVPLNQTYRGTVYEVNATVTQYPYASELLSLNTVLLTSTGLVTLFALFYFVFLLVKEQKDNLEALGKEKGL